MCPNIPDDQILLPNVKKKLKALTIGNEIAIATNQGGVSSGFLTEATAWRIIFKTIDLLDIKIKDIAVSFYHKDGKLRNYYIDNSKPKPNLINLLIQKHNLKKKDIIFIILQENHHPRGGGK